VPDSTTAEEPARRAGRALTVRAAKLAAEARQAARLDQQDEQQLAPLVHDDRRQAGRLAAEHQPDASALAEQDQRESRRATPMSFALRADLKERLAKFRDEGGSINVSAISNEAIERELDRIQSGNAVVQRLRVELYERRGPSWTLGYQAGRKWAEEIASWLEITTYASKYTDQDVDVVVINEQGFDMWAQFMGSFRAPERDYGSDAPNNSGAPAFIRSGDESGPKWEYRSWEMVAFWRAWLHAVRELYEQNKDHLPSVVDRLPSNEIPQPAPADVDPDDIPF
jgi:hypothetical protein